MADREEWRTVPDWPLYEVSSLGQVRSYHPRWLKPTSVTGGKPRILSQTRVSGFARVVLVSEEGERRDVLVHVLMARAFLRAPSAVHIDGKRNVLSNLEPSSGMAESVSLKRPAKITAERVVRIVEDGVEERGEVSESMARQIRSGRKWRAVTEGMDMPAHARARRDAAIAASDEPTRVLAERHGLCETRVRLIRQKARESGHAPRR